MGERKRDVFFAARGRIRTLIIYDTFALSSSALFVEGLHELHERCAGLAGGVVWGVAHRLEFSL